ncbi:amino ABC transporter, permease, 3-TM region, His/Glu/Gln/Arg/opine family domain protein [Paraburkholderia xenovorans LB400]|uniref:Amino acid ABC transporter membrane protein 2, PAAT family n=1 Tax=Paraburkholderia xenovorans (strain LB400) TaxID=266265 RepID=Q13ZF1_PARXL|nr:ABC transporter permease subunit [Paraburkholderia xenovorans]ABE30538.1 amino acid ABC transporter membrane protein 2, PAAT family [Paraburkholderia xenovorans LB400]AIP30274.1 amino ABC transporter, permease, 3-TM region, His/Glu/Gln/Arg/opine family domain protein [Paraburkholderia xenovorans LB400]
MSTAATVKPGRSSRAMQPETRAFAYGMIGVPLLLVVALVGCYGHQSGGAFALLAARNAMLLTGAPGAGIGGFCANILMSLAAMCVSLVTGVLLCVGTVAQTRWIRFIALGIVNLLRNTPWLIALYAMLYLLPFYVPVFGVVIPFSPFVKAVAGLSLPVTANVAEAMRGGIEAIPSGQWESARALGYRKNQILRYVIVPQAIPFIMPNMMTVFAMLFIGSSLAVVTGTSDVLSVANTITASDGSHYATAVQMYVLLLFFLFAFPIATLARRLERQMREKS